MTLTELLLQVGDENLQFQNLLNSLVDIKTNRKGISKVTFETNAISCSDVVAGCPEKTALVVWIPKSKIPPIS
jgi:hypothetical protein